MCRQATADEAGEVGHLLDAFNGEFGDETPGPEVLSRRLVELFAGGNVFAVLAGRPAVGVALVTLRPNVWFDGPVGLLDELYVVPHRRNRGIGTSLLRAVEEMVRARGGELLEINVDGEDADARRFYERHGYACRHSERPEPELYYSKDL